VANADRIIDLLHEARARSAGADREQFLAEACRGDAALKEQILSLLEADAAESKSDFLKVTQIVRPSILPSEKAGDRIGRYKLLEQIGEGGCGVVYVAEQEKPVRRRVALKVIKLGMDTKQVIARFDAERQALALMDHPNIAKVLDGGATDNGRPYFVMELVRGIKITDFCRQNKLSITDRLNLFIQVCRAIRHAHQKGVIHRDIKPSNVLVASNDGVPLPKVIDFGIAKATQGRLTDQTVYTAFEQFIGTPAYMSPEQAALTLQDIDTRSDIYSMGVMLYELLTGTTPFDARELLSKGLDEMRRTIREVEPIKPSTRLTQTVESQILSPKSEIESAGANRQSAIPSDLDWIVMKCLEKDRTRRYETADGLAADIQRHLKCEVVMARPPSRLYVFQKTVRRHKFGFAAAAAILLALAVGVVVSTSQAVRAWRAQKREQQARTAADDARQRETAQRRLAEENAQRATESQRKAQRLLYAADMKLAQAAWDEGNLSRMVSLLDAHHPKPGEADPRGFEFFYLQELAKGEQEYALSGYTNSADALAVSPDGRYVATRSETTTRLWNLERRALVGTWPSLQTRMAWAYRAAFGISFSHDSRYLAFPSKEGLSFCDLTTMQVRLVRTGAVAKPLFAPDSPRMALSTGSSRSTTVIWDYEANKELGTLGPDCAVLSWSLDGLHLLAGDSHGSANWIGVWDATTLKRTGTNRFGQYIFGAALSPDGQLLAAADWQGEVGIFQTANGKLMGSVDAGDIRSSALAFSPDGKSLATASRNQAIIIWSVQSLQPTRQLRGHRAKVFSLAYTTDGRRLISGDEEGNVLVWNLAHDSRGLEITNQLRTWGGVYPQFSADGKFLAVTTTESEFTVFDTSSWEKIANIEGQMVAFSPDSRDYAFAIKRHGEPLLCVSHIGAQTPRAALHLEPGLSTGTIQASPLGNYLSQYTIRNVSDFEISVFDCTAREETIAERTTEVAPFCSRFLPDNQTWVCAVGPELRFWDLRSRRVKRVLDCRSVFGLSAFDCVAVSPDGRFLAASRNDFAISLWDLEAGAEVATLAGHQSWVRILEFSADSRTLASGSEDRSVKLWDLASLRETASFLQEKAAYWLKFSPDNQMLVVGGIGSFRVWRAPRGPTEPAVAVAKPPDLKELPTGSIWRAPDGEGPRTLRVEMEKAQCFTNLAKIHAAIEAYRKDHGQIPDWLSELVPQYLTDTNCLICPTRDRTGRPPSDEPAHDPKLTTSYSYHFSARANPYADPFGLAVPGDTFKSWKTRQLAHYGTQVPVVRCSAHGGYLCVTYAGERWETARMWEPQAELRLRTRDPAGMEAWVRQLEQDGNVKDLNQFAWSWATSFLPEARNGAAAVRLAESAAALTKRKDASILDTLSVAYAETGQFDKAILAESDAIATITAAPQTAKTRKLLRDLQSRKELFTQHRPYRE